ncbi:hypothetical protein [Francisella orientalis]|uniref:Transmembrane protein n=1 Tax=Francisella orientalis TaxID=299583 RepID=A0AAP6X8M7_9GAMM|nr:hypothetical protein [Francisella orientalis]AFJ43241.1 hypothetical protein OOM_0753 [Francisella orientalis str. Toba 04]AHB99298.1 hypothetical protein M973_08575 [Francisella orientalis LADL 07-285A]AKN86097.1 hypothetical protein FNO12_1554 [Francisella orientalis FNO12]AKN87635.1 Hypothetical protein FNO24_1556 [Francisella orientalis FNO24]AKN89173.1 Hypothetical protein FNO190_1554 [Francisella orientalis]
MRSLQEKLQDYKNKHQDKQKEKIQLQDIKEIKQKVIKQPGKLLQQQSQNKDEYLRFFILVSMIVLAIIYILNTGASTQYVNQYVKLQAFC